MFNESDRALLHAMSASMSRIERRLASTQDEMEEIMATLQDVQDEVTAETTVDAGLLALINTLVANQNDPAKLSAILASMKQNIAPLSAALTANTPPPPPTPAPVPPVVAPATV